jgi:hypothetical protein
LAATRKRVLRGDRGQPWLRSVDSERSGRAIEPRKSIVEEAEAVDFAEGNTEAPESRDPSRNGPALRFLRGLRARHDRKDLPGTREAPPLRMRMR